MIDQKMVQARMSALGMLQYYDPADPLVPIYSNLVVLYAKSKDEQGPVVMAGREAQLRVRLLIGNSGPCAPGAAKTSVPGPGAAKIGGAVASTSAATLGSVGGAVNSFAAAGTALGTFGQTALWAAGPVALVALPFMIWSII